MLLIILVLCSYNIRFVCKVKLQAAYVLVKLGGGRSGKMTTIKWNYRYCVYMCHSDDEVHIEIHCVSERFIV